MWGSAASPTGFSSFRANTGIRSVVLIALWGLVLVLKHRLRLMEFLRLRRFLLDGFAVARLLSFGAGSCLGGRSVLVRLARIRFDVDFSCSRLGGSLRCLGHSSWAFLVICDRIRFLLLLVAPPALA